MENEAAEETKENEPMEAIMVNSNSADVISEFSGSNPNDESLTGPIKMEEEGPELQPSSDELGHTMPLESSDTFEEQVSSLKYRCNQLEHLLQNEKARTSDAEQSVQRLKGLLAKAHGSAKAQGNVLAEAHQRIKELENQLQDAVSKGEVAERQVFELEARVKREECRRAAEQRFQSEEAPNDDGMKRRLQEKEEQSKLAEDRALKAETKLQKLEQKLSLVKVGAMKAEEQAQKQLETANKKVQEAEDRVEKLKEQLKQLRSNAPAAAALMEVEDVSSDEESSRQKDGWHQMFGQLREHVIINGNCTVSSKSNPKLYNWVNNQRHVYRSNKQGSGSKTMTVDKIRKLESLGFSWGKNCPPTRSWKQNYDDLKKYKESQGHCNVPICPNNPSVLARWVTNQRQEYKHRVKGRDSLLKQEQVEMLNEIGFSWRRPR
jgi:Helicase associated domain